MKNNQQTPWREALKLNTRALKLFYQYYPQIILSRFFSVIWISLTPYVEIYLSALIIDELAGNKNPARLR